MSDIIFAASDPKTGACGSCLAAHDLAFHNHKLQVVPHVLAPEASELLKAFFKQRR